LLAYLFWHAPASADITPCEDRLRAFHAAIAAHPPPGFRSSASFALHSRRCHGSASLRIAQLVTAVFSPAWISCKLHTRIGSRRRDATACTLAFAALSVVMHGTR